MSQDKTSSISANVVTIILIVIGVATIGWIFWTGREIGVQTERTELIAAIWRHVGYGVVLAPLSIAYLWIRVKTCDIVRWGWFSNTVFCFLLICVLFLLLSGPVVVWTYGSDLKVFDWFTIPNPIGAMSGLHDGLEAAHVIVAKVTPWVLATDSLLALTAMLRPRPIGPLSTP